MSKYVKKKKKIWEGWGLKVEGNFNFFEEKSGYHVIYKRVLAYKTDKKHLNMFIS